MMRILFLVVAVAARLAVVASRSGTYVVMSPSKFRPHSDFTVSVNILDASQGVNVTASISKLSTTTPIASAKGIFYSGSTGTLNLKIPGSLTSTSYTLKVDGTGGLTFTNTTVLGFSDKEFSLFIQTDKGIYKAGDVVNFRVFGMYSDLKPYLGPVDINIFDKDSNKIKQWLQVKLKDGVVTQKLQLSSQPTLGDWKISVQASRTYTEKVFAVAEYVLPKFEVSVILPSYVLTSDTVVTATIKAKYTYGKPVKGTVDVGVKMLDRYYSFDYSRNKEIMTLLKVALDGETKVTFPMSRVKAVNNYLDKHKLIVSANVTEDLTGNVMSANSTVTMYNSEVKLEFPESNPKTFKPGLNYTALLKISQPDGLPVNPGSDQIIVSTRVTVELPQPANSTTPWPFYNRPSNSINLPDMSISVPDNGMVAIPVTVETYATDVSITAKLSGVQTTLDLGKSHSPSNSYIQLALGTASKIQAGDIIDLMVTSTQPLNQLVYQVLSRGRIVKTGAVRSSGKNFEMFSLATNASMAPNARIVAYYVRADGEIVTDSISFNVDGAFLNKVSVKVNTTTTGPGDSVEVTVDADPSSVAHLAAIDQSVLLLRSGNDVTAGDVMDELEDYDTISIQTNPGFGGGIRPFGGCVNCRRKRAIWWGWPVYYGGSDAKKILENSGVKVLTDCLVYHYEEPFLRHQSLARSSFWAARFESKTVSKTSAVESVPTRPTKPTKPTKLRSNFAESWLWNEMILGAASRKWHLCGWSPCANHGTDAHAAIRDVSVSGRQLAKANCYPNVFFPRAGYGLKPKCPIFEDMLFPAAAGFGGGAPELAGAAPPPNAAARPQDSSGLQEPSRIRSDFSETWLFVDSPIGANGSATTTAKIPDTITSWVVSAFATNQNTGLGVAPSQAKFTVFKPFFVSLNLPYSVTRGEHLALQANVFNYLQQDVTVRVTLAKSADYLNIFIDANGLESWKQEEVYQDVMIVAGEAKSVFFPIIPATLGRINLDVTAATTVAADRISKQLLVEAEGRPIEYNVPVLIDLTDTDTTFSKTVDLTLPGTVVSGSELVRVSAVGDLMGPSIEGLDSLLHMPTGCGEQNMLGLAPDVYVTDYLKAVNQLSSDIESKALGYMESGYQRELTYKHKDGSFSAFGENDHSGSMWLTAFVTRVFHQAKSHIFVDENVLKIAIKWMLRQQATNGSFPEPGRVIHKDMQGQAAGGLGLTCFVYISLLENEDIFTLTEAVKLKGAMTKALSYLEKEIATTSDPYILAMASYAFTLAGSSQAQTVLDRLEAMAVKDGDMRYWHKADAVKPRQGSWRSPHDTKAVDTEMTSYVLLAYAAKGDIVAGKGIMQWVAQQRNPNGGFTSTQDTVVALSALSQFAKMTLSDDYNVHITAKLDSAPTYTFNIVKSNSLLKQTYETSKVPAKVHVDASGKGMALVEVAVFFNVESEVEAFTFDLTVNLIEETMNWLVIETCTRWLGAEDSSAMAIQEIGIPSGFSIDPETITQLSILKRIEQQNKKVILYFDQIGTSDVCLTFRAQRVNMVAKSQPTAIRVYDYYEPGNQVTQFYESRILKESTVCEVCPDCENCV